LLTHSGTGSQTDDALVPTGHEEVSLSSPKPARAAIDACEALARAGKLPGFQRLSPTSCSARLFGQPFDRDLIADAADSASGSVVRLSSRLRRKFPVIFVIVAIFTVWPGVWLTDSLIQTYFAGASSWIIKTWMWYLPISIIPLPFAARSMWRKSQKAAAEHFAEVQERIAQAVGASMDASRSASSATPPGPKRFPEAISASA
jgi:hypothetical protein